MKCKECADTIKVYFCNLCNKDIENTCKECHDELEHDIVNYKPEEILVVGEINHDSREESLNNWDDIVKVCEDDRGRFV